MKKQTTKRATSIKNKIGTAKKTSNNKALMVGGAVVVLAGIAAAYYFFRKAKKKKESGFDREFPEIVSATPTMKSTLRPINTFQPSTRAGSRFKCSSSSYPLKYGTCHNDVKILQKHLKSFGENLGRSGSSRDGVDGQFGNLTLKAAQKRLGKTTFSKTDIAAFAKTSKMVKL